ncbi:MAG: tetratricopeptide repeat protein [Bacteroidaceae bacterium]|nr:tetratricopeptide repeat protein [Bacteroidaceae bacterium]
MSKKTNLLLRYESMLRGESVEWFDTEDYEEIALEYEMASMLSNAIEAIEMGLKYHPMSEELLARKAYFLLIKGQIEEAENLMSVVTDKSDETQLIRVELRLISGDIDEAITLIKELLKGESLQSEHLLSVIDLCADYKLYKEILLDIFTSIGKFERTQQLYLLREFMKVLEEESEYKLQLQVVEKILDMDPYSYHEWLRAIELYLYHSDIQKAFEAIDYALAIDPKNSDALYYKAYCYAEQGYYKDAIIILESLEKSKNEYIYTLMATCYNKLGLYDKSDRVLDESLQYYPLDAKILYVKAQNRYKSQQPLVAIDLLRQAEEIEPHSSDILYMLSKLYYEQESYDKAKETFLKLESSDYEESDAKVYILGGDIATKRGEYREALNYYERAFALDKYDVDTCLKMLYTYSELHDIENMQRIIDYVEDLISDSKIETLPDEEQCRVHYLRAAIDKIKNILRNHIDETI